MTTTDRAPVRRALLSVSDKAGIVEFARELAARGVELLSTGGTYKLLKDSGLAAIEVSGHTGFPEIMDGRVRRCIRRSTAACSAAATSTPR